jgi:hypothetical protein
MRSIALPFLMLVLAAVTPPARGGESQGQTAEVWNLGTLEPDKVYPTTLSARNQSCRGEREFIFSIEGAPWLRITGPKRVVAARGETAITAAVVDLQGVSPGTYDDGKVVTRCPECPPKCLLDYRAIEIRLTVAAPRAPGPPAEIQEGGGRPGGAGAAGAADPAAALADAWENLQTFTEDYRGRELTSDEVEKAHAQLWDLTTALREAQAEFLGWQAVTRKDELEATTRSCLEEAYARLDALVGHFAEMMARLQEQEARTDEAYARFNELLRECKRWRGIAPPAQAVRNAGLVSQAAWEAKNEELELRKLEAEADLRATADEIAEVEKRIDECLAEAIDQLSRSGGGLGEPGPGPDQVLLEPYSGRPTEDLGDSPRAQAWGLGQLIEDLTRERGDEMRRKIEEAEEEKRRMRRELEEGGGNAR